MVVIYAIELWPTIHPALDRRHRSLQGYRELRLVFGLIDTSFTTDDGERSGETYYLDNVGFPRRPLLCLRAAWVPRD
jgi:hypothetical protein